MAGNGSTPMTKDHQLARDWDAFTEAWERERR